jgi:hypothetical protein
MRTSVTIPSPGSLVVGPGSRSMVIPGRGEAVDGAATGVGGADPPTVGSDLGVEVEPPHETRTSSRGARSEALSMGHSDP